MLDHVMGVASDIAEKSPLAVHGSKVMINYARDHSIADGLDYIATWQAGMYNPETDMKESFVAKAEKRAPNSTTCCRSSRRWGRSSGARRVPRPGINNIGDACASRRRSQRAAVNARLDCAFAGLGLSFSQGWHAIQRRTP